MELSYGLQSDIQQDGSAAAQTSCGKDCGRELDKGGTKLKRNNLKYRKLWAIAAEKFVQAGQKLVCKGE